MRKVSITTSSFGQDNKAPLDLLNNNDLEVILNPYKRKLEQQEIIEVCKDSIGIIAGTETLDGETLNKLPDLEVISRCGTGMDNVDLDAAKELGIKVFNTPDAPTAAVAELTLGLMLDLMRKISLMDRDIRKDTWHKRMGNLLSEKKVGIIGFGKIGRKVAELLRAFNCEIAYTDSYVEDGSMGLKKLPLDELLAFSDIISIHVSSKETLITDEILKQMKKGSWLVNVSRGQVVDEDALYQALDNNRLAGAAIDVFAQEPYEGPLKELDNVILTPHIGSYAKEARIRMEIEASENLIKGLNFG